MAIIGKVTSKGQTTIPREIREALSLKPGESIEWAITTEGRAEIRRVPPSDLAYLRAVQESLSEWTSAEDDAAYHDL